MGRENSGGNGQKWHGQLENGSGRLGTGESNWEFSFGGLGREFGELWEL